MTLADYRPHPTKSVLGAVWPGFRDNSRRETTFRAQTFGGRSIRRTPRCVNALRASSPVVHDPLQKLLANAWRTSTNGRPLSNQQNRIEALV